MPRDLPGMYWDEQRRRYFPLVSRRAQPHSDDVRVSDPASHTKKKQHDPVPISNSTPRQYRKSNSYHLLGDLRSVVRTVQKDRLLHQLQLSQISLTDKVTRSTITASGPVGLFSAFQTCSCNGSVWSFVGDTNGWFYSSVVDNEREEMGWHSTGWRRQFNLSSEVSSICISGAMCIATSFGPTCEVLYLPMDSGEENFQILKADSRTVHDVWTADLRGSRLVLGANKQAVVIDDIADRASMQRLPTQSDVFALAQRDNILYTGLRNGSILRFDTRMQKPKGHSTLYGHTQHPVSITNLKRLRDHQLLVSFVDGRISTFDQRFPCQTPVMDFTGNVNSYTMKLPLVVDPYENFFFSAGQDNRIRLWSLNRGGPPLDPVGLDAVCPTALQRLFEHPITALQIVEENEGMRLWAASGTELYKYDLGHHTGENMRGLQYRQVHTVISLKPLKRWKDRHAS